MLKISLYWVRFPYIVRPYQLHVEWRSLEISSLSHTSMNHLRIAIAQNCYVRIAMHIYIVHVVPCTACTQSEFYNMYAFITTIYKLSMHASRSSYA